MSALNGAVVTGGATYAIERWFNQEPEAMKLAALGAAAHIGGNIVANRFAVGPNTGTVVAAGVYAFAAPKVARVNQPDAYMTRFLVSIGANIGGKAAGNALMGGMNRWESAHSAAVQSVLTGV